MTGLDINNRIDTMEREVRSVKAFLALGSFGEAQRELHNIEIDLGALRQQVDELQPVNWLEAPERMWEPIRTIE